MGMDPELMKRASSEIGHMLGQNLPKGTGFVVILFDTTGGGGMTFVSNASKREVSINIVRKVLMQLERRESPIIIPPGFRS
jgi:hypothetical protein